ncbi:uncharacterized protein LOC129909950 [Episyrphus balteatus]|uniref:uncharacterized protein LOC129909950 n=1 Tax=Episyrphus balteatus TaxID=286459 RepID=UPI002484EE15|nr:uncharacterized protein LOC129909950 [Episyrphus balteatus]
MNPTNNENISSISRQYIYNFPFPYKLWIAVNSISCKFIKWNIDGTQIEVQLVALDSYLNSPMSIFTIKSRSTFVNHLRGYAFQLIKTEVKDIQRDQQGSPTGSLLSPIYSEIVMHFNHMHFLRHRIHLLANIRLVNSIPCPSVYEGDHQTTFMDNNRLENDLCFKRMGSGSQLSKAQLKHQLVLNFLSEVKTLESKLKASESRSKAMEQEGNEEDSMIELSAELFENPHDSVLYMGDEHRTAYAGFYGNCTNEQVLKFFGPYLPMYENDNNDEGEKRIANLNLPGKPTSQSNGFEINYSVNEETTIIPSENVAQQNGPLPCTPLQPPLQFPQPNISLPSVSSSLEPIFITENEQNDDEKDEDILMDEFIKFKEQTENQESTTEPIEKPDIKMEQVHNEHENEENETNFKNFFNQYRESLSLLYEKQ